MFESREQLVSELIAAGLGSYAERIGEYAQPYLHFTMPSAASGLVRLGGSPELPAGTSWPYRAALPHVNTLKATRLRNDRLAAVWGVPCPLTFLAQVDLSMAAAAYPGPWPLPSRGRLSFFWDPLCGCHGQGVANARVIWDDTDASKVVPLDHPISDYSSDVADLPPVMPARSVDLKPAWSCPSRDMMRWLVSDEKLQEVLNGDPFQAFYWRSNEDTFKDRSHRHRMLGWCTPTNVGRACVRGRRRGRGHRGLSGEAAYS